MSLSWSVSKRFSYYQRYQKARKTIFLLFTIFFLNSIFSSISYAAPKTFNFQAHIKKPDGKALESSSVNFRFTYLDEVGSCVLYSEDFAGVALPVGGGGLVNIALGTGSRVYPSAGSTVLYDVFSNSGVSLTCQSGAIFTPVSTDRRSVVMQFSYSGSSGWQTLAPIKINSVPYAMYSGESLNAENATKLGGVASSSYTKKTDFTTCVGSEVLTFNGTSFSCTTPAGGGTVTNVTASAPLSSTGGATPNITLAKATASADGYLSSADWSTFNGKLSPANNLSDLASVATARTNLGLGTAAVLNAPASGDASAVELVKGDDSRLNNALQTSSSLSGDVTGTISTTVVSSVGGKTAANIATSVNDTQAATSSNTGSTIVRRNASGDFTGGVISATTFSGTNVSANNTSTQNVYLYDALNINRIIFKAPSAGITNYTLTLPATAGTNGQILSTNASGDLSWVSAATGSVTDVTATAPLSSTGGATPAISIAKANGTTDGYLASTDWTMFNDKLGTASTFSGDVSGTSSTISVDKIKGIPLVFASLIANNYLRYNGTNWVNANLVSTDITSSLGFIPLNPANNLSDLASAATARTNLGLGTAAVLNAPSSGDASAAELVKGNDSRLTGAFQSASSLSGDVTGTVNATVVSNVGGKSSADITASVNDTQTATNNNTASTIVKRDVSGNFAAGVITATTFSGTIVNTTNVSADNTRTKNLYLYDSASNNILFKAPSTVTSNYTLTLPAALGINGQILSTNASGDLSWVNAATGSVTDVTATAPLSSTGGATPAISIAKANGTTDGYLASTDWTMFNDKLGTASTFSGDVSGTSSTIVVDKIKGTAVGGSATTAGQFLVYNGTTQYVPLILSGDATMSSTGVLNLVNTIGSSGTSSKVTYDAKGRITAVAAQTSTDITTALGYTPLNKAGDTMTGALNMGGYTINGNTTASGNLRLDSTSNSTKGNIILAAQGGYVGVGTSAPTAPLHLSLVNDDTTFIISNTQSTAARYPGMVIENYMGSTPGANAITMRAARGTSAAKTATQSGDVLAQLIGRGWDSTVFGLAAQIEISAASNYTTGVTPGDINFYTTNTSGTFAERMLISADGDVGIGTSAPDAKLDVYNGDVTVTADDAWYALQAREFSNNKYAEIIASRKRGTYASPLEVQSGDILGALSFRNISANDGAEVRGIATENHSGTAYGTALGFYTIGNTTVTPTERMRIDQNGNIKIGSQATRTTASAGRGQMSQSSTYVQTTNVNAAVDWNNGNIQEISTFACDGSKTITMSNVKDGATYSIFLSGTAAHSGVCSFVAAGYTFKTKGGAAAPTTSKDVLFTFTVIGTTIIYSMTDNLQ